MGDVKPELRSAKDEWARGKGEPKQEIKMKIRRLCRANPNLWAVWNPMGPLK